MSLIKVDVSTPDIAIITMNRPEKRNALSIQLLQEFIEAINTHALSHRALIFAADGPVFSAGMDLTEAADPALAEDLSNHIAHLFTTIYLAPCVTISAIQGDVLAGGAGIVMASDFAVMAQGASVSFPEVRKGIVPALVAVMLHRQIAMRHVRELLLFGQKVDATRAMQMGVVNQVVPAVNVLNAALVAAKAAAEGNPATIHKLKKQLLEIDPVSFQDEIFATRDLRGVSKETS